MRKAHRLAPVREEDWGYLACFVDGDVHGHGKQQVWLNKGLLGLSWAAYWWRLGGPRRSQHVGIPLEMWALFVVGGRRQPLRGDGAHPTVAGWCLVGGGDLVCATVLEKIFEMKKWNHAASTLSRIANDHTMRACIPL